MSKLTVNIIMPPKTLKMPFLKPILLSFYSLVIKVGFCSFSFMIFFHKKYSRNYVG